jgi:imidazoleglycerol-phosphate dehydratase
VASRVSVQRRETGETQVSIRLDLDGTGKYELDTGNGMFDHLLAQLSRHGLMDLTVNARGDIDAGWHHLVEDTGLVLGRAIREAVGDGAGIVRMAHAYVPLDEALARAVVDFSGRGYSVLELELGDSDLGGLSGDLVRHFLESLAREGGFNLHIQLLAGRNNHHRAEAVFKATARAMRAALTVDERLGSQVSSTKGTISG